MDNFLFGLQAVIDLFVTEVVLLYYSEIVRGFAVGYFVASLIYGYIYTTTKKPRKTI